MPVPGHLTCILLRSCREAETHSIKEVICMDTSCVSSHRLYNLLLFIKKNENQRFQVQFVALTLAIYQYIWPKLLTVRNYTGRAAR